MAMPKLEQVIPKPETRVAIVVDNSSSMNSLKEFVVNTFNEQVDELRKVKDQKITVSLVFFDSDVDVRMFNVPLEEIKNLKMEDYRPAGMTALDDATGVTVDKFKSIDGWQDENVSHLVVVITDGYGNVNKEFSQQNVANMIKELQDGKGWTFTYLGANVDVKKIARTYNLHDGNTMSYSASDKVSLNASTEATTRGLGGYFRGRSKGLRTSMSFYDAQGDNIMEQGKKLEISNEEDKNNLTDKGEDAKLDIHMGNKDLWDQALDANDKKSQEIKEKTK